MQRGALDIERDLCKQAKEMGMASLADEWHMHVRGCVRDGSSPAARLVANEGHNLYRNL